jgi:hypothetical protein
MDDHSDETAPSRNPPRPQSLALPTLGGGVEDGRDAR